MSQLTRLIEFLDRDDVSEVVVATGRPVTLRMGGEYRPLGKAPATVGQLEALFAGSPIADLIASGGGGVERMRLAERDCAIDVQVHGEQVLIRLTRARGAAFDPGPARGRSGNSSGPIAVVAAPPPPREPPAAPVAPVTAAASGAFGRPVEAQGSGVFGRAADGVVQARAAEPPPRVSVPAPRAAEPAPPPRRISEPALTPVRAPEPARARDGGGSGSLTPPADDGELDALIIRSSDGGPGAVAGSRDGAPLPVVATRRKSITIPPIARGSSPVLEPVALEERSAVPVTGGGPAAARHSIELPPDPPGTPPVEVTPTSSGAAMRPKTAGASGAHPVPPATRPVLAPVAAPSAVAAVAEVAAPAPAPAAIAPGYTPGRRHTITAAPSIEPLPPLDQGKARATPELLAILAGARGRNASDLHLTGDRAPMERTVRGLEAVGRPLSAAEVEVMLASLLSPSQRALLDARGYVDAALDVEGAGRLRANISRFRGGVKGSFRLVLSAPPTLEQLGLPRELAKVTSYHQGLVVIAGPNGHGKTSTLAALVDLINTQKAHHILTIEDPVEIQHPRKKAVISQREVGNHTRSFAAALKASLREDPDVIVIGELRDRETVEIALTAAETGHLVMATMSTPSAAKSLDRLIDMFPPDDQQQVRTSLAAALKFVVSQRLLPSVDGASLVAAVELLTGVLPLAALIRDNKLFQVASLQQRGRAFGMIRFDDSLLELARAGRISEDTAIRAADNKKDLTLALRGPAPPPAAPPRGPGDGKGRLGGLFGAGRRSE